MKYNSVKIKVATANATGFKEIFEEEFNPSKHVLFNAEAPAPVAAPLAPAPKARKKK